MSSVYSNELTIMDFVLDREFIAMYGLKIITFVILLISLLISEHLFSNMYMKKVYAEGGNPPSILNFVGIYFGIDLAFVLFLITVLFLMSHIFKNPANNFVVNTQLIKLFAMDHAVGISVLVLFSLIVGGIIAKKKYFRYKTEGLRAARALKEVVMAFGALVFLIPYFAFF